MRAASCIPPPSSVPCFLSTSQYFHLPSLHLDRSDAHRPPEGRAGHRAGGEETDSGGQFCVSRRGSVRRRGDGEREVR